MMTVAFAQSYQTLAKTNRKGEDEWFDRKHKEKEGEREIKRQERV